MHNKGVELNPGMRRPNSARGHPSTLEELDRSDGTLHISTRETHRLAQIRAAEWGTFPYWQSRIRGYISGDLHPHQALAPRVVILASEGDRLVGFVAGHLTQRHGCDGELEWINVIPEQRGTGIATELLRRLAAWFAQQSVNRVCVDVDPQNVAARTFYTRHGAVVLNSHWLVWDNITGIVNGGRGP